jgi:hypothetical protein
VFVLDDVPVLQERDPHERAKRANPNSRHALVASFRRHELVAKEIAHVVAESVAKVSRKDPKEERKCTL